MEKFTSQRGKSTHGNHFLVWVIALFRLMNHSVEEGLRLQSRSKLVDNQEFWKRSAPLLPWLENNDSRLWRTILDSKLFGYDWQVSLIASYLTTLWSMQLELVLPLPLALIINMQLTVGLGQRATLHWEDWLVRWWKHWLFSWQHSGRLLTLHFCATLYTRHLVNIILFYRYFYNFKK